LKVYKEVSLLTQVFGDARIASDVIERIQLV